MSFFTVNTNKDEVKDFKGTGGGFIGSKSGMFPVKIKHALIMENANGVVHINLIVEHEGNETTIYRAFPLKNKGGAPNEIGSQSFNNFLITCGITGNIEPEMQDIPLGKDRVVTECATIAELEGVEVILNIKRRFSWYADKNTVTMSPTVVSSFRVDDNASAAEIVNDADAGKQYEFEAKSADKDKLDKGVTQEMVDDFLAQKSGGTSTAPAQDNKPSTGFSAGSRFKK